MASTLRTEAEPRFFDLSCRTVLRRIDIELFNEGLNLEALVEINRIRFVKITPKIRDDFKCFGRFSHFLRGHCWNNVFRKVM